MSHTTVLEDLKRSAWNRTSPVTGQANSWEIRKDCLGNLVRYNDFGNRHSPFGWELEYIVSRTAGGSTDPSNLQVLHWKAAAVRAEPQLRMLTLHEAVAAEASRR